MNGVGNVGAWFEWTPNSGPKTITLPDGLAIASLWFPAVPVPITIEPLPTPTTGISAYIANANNDQPGAETVPMPTGTTSAVLTGTYADPIYVFASNRRFNPYKEVPIVGVEAVLADAPLVSSGGITPTISLDILADGNNRLSVIDDALTAFVPYAVRLQFSGSDLTPMSGPDTGGVLVVPFSPVDDTTVVTWNVIDIFMRAETPGTTETEVHVEYYEGTGDFVSAGNVDASGVSIASGVNESTRPAAIGVAQLQSGWKVRPNYALVGSGVQGVALYMVLQQEIS